MLVTFVNKLVNINGPVVVNAVHAENQLLVSVTLLKLNPGTDFKLTQEANGVTAVVTFAKLYNGKDCKLEQPLNILEIVVTLVVLNNGTAVMLGLP